jgi:hypothetical protein
VCSRKQAMINLARERVVGRRLTGAAVLLSSMLWVAMDFPRSTGALPPFLGAGEHRRRRRFFTTSPVLEAGRTGSGVAVSSRSTTAAGARVRWGGGGTMGMRGRQLYSDYLQNSQMLLFMDVTLTLSKL